MHSVHAALSVTRPPQRGASFGSSPGRSYAASVSSHAAAAPASPKPSKGAISAALAATACSGLPPLLRPLGASPPIRWLQPAPPTNTTLATAAIPSHPRPDAMVYV